jgi:putative ABC transport system permease protein
MTVLLSALTFGAILSLLALGVFLSFRIFTFADITPDGSLPLGACVTTALLVSPPTGLERALIIAAASGVAVAVGLVYLWLSEGKPPLSTIASSLGVGVLAVLFVLLCLRVRNPVVATAAGFASGVLAGMTTGILNTRFQINRLLSGILVMTALYSVNLHILGKSNVSLQNATTLATYAENVGIHIGGQKFNLLGWEVGAQDVSMLVLSFTLVLLTALALYAFLRTQLGTAMRATGDCPQMMCALGVNVGHMLIGGLGLSNGLIALSGSLYAQYQGFADVQMGIGMVVWGLASVIMGEALVGAGRLGLTLAGAVMGSVLFRLLIAIALRAGLDPADLKLITALFVFLALVFPSALGQVQTWFRRRPPGVKPGQPDAKKDSAFIPLPTLR